MEELPLQTKLERRCGRCRIRSDRLTKVAGLSIELLPRRWGNRGRKVLPSLVSSKDGRRDPGLGLLSIGAVVDTNSMVPRRRGHLGGIFSSVVAVDVGDSGVVYS